MNSSAGHPTQSDYLRLLHSALEGLAGHVDESDSHLKSKISALARGIDERSTSVEIQAALTAALEFIHGSHLTCSKRAADQIVELRSIMRSMTETVTFLSESRTTAVQQLNYIERQLEQATEIEDVRFLRSRLSKCLELVRKETARLNSESTIHAETPSRRLGSLDRVTGLPGREIGERLLSEKITAGRDCSLALFVPERLASVKKRHGSNAEDEVLVHVAQHLARQIPASVSLCRWTGPAFFAFAEAQTGSADPERVWKQLVGRHIEQTIELDRRTVLVRITLASVVKRVSPGMPLIPLFQELDEFVVASTREI
ncbi:MAG: GGDEF domain-containing protein [Acidobacteriota bacterium]|nr:GGDEF domain-containing protein [Acidobacteriota bacterium]